MGSPGIYNSLKIASGASLKAALSLLFQTKVMNYLLYANFAFDAEDCFRSLIFHINDKSHF